MPITAISRNFDGNPNIVTIITTDDLTAITTTGYVSSQSDVIAALQNGIFEWFITDLIVISYSPALLGLFVYDFNNDTFDALSPSSGLSDTLPSGDVFVGNGSNIATARAISGAFTLSNTGVATLAANAIGFNQVNETVSAQNIVSLTSAEIKTMYTTPVQLIAAQGANTFIVVDEIVWDINFATTQYTGGGVIAAQYGNGAHGAGIAATTSLSAATLNGISASSFLYMGANTSLNVLKIEAENVGVYLSNATGVFATGNSDAVLYVKYHLLTAV